MKPPFPALLKQNYLQDSIIAFRYLTDYSTTYIETRLLEFLSQNNIRDFEKLRKKEQKKLETNADIEYLVVKRYFYANRKYILEVNDNEIKLNCTKEYVGWEDYRRFIEKIIEFLDSIQVDFKTIEMQYISTFPDTDILGAVDGSIKLNCYPRLEGTQFRFSMPVGDHEGRYNPLYTTVILTNYVHSKQDGQNQKLSYVDIHLLANIGEVPVREMVEHIHQQEKNLFFSMMAKTFIDSLEPIYNK